MSHAADEGGVPADAVQITTDSVSLEREPEFRDEGVVLTYRLETDTGDPEVVTVSDVVPAPLPTESAGFHPDNEPVDWDLEDRALSFETVVPRQGERIIVFGVALADATPSDVVLSEPVIESVRPAADRDDLDAALPDVETPDRADAIAQVIEGAEDDAEEGDDATGFDEGAISGQTEASSSEIEAALETLADDEPERMADGDAEANGDVETDETDVTIDLGDPAGRSTAPGTDTGSESSESTDGSVPEGGLVDALVTELESDRVTDDQRDALAEALDLEPSNSLDVRLGHVQSRMDDFAAYADALEGIIDEHGTADAFMAEIRDSVEAMEREVAAVDDRLDDVVDRLDTTAERIDELEAAASDRDEQLGSVVADLEDIEESLRGRDRLVATVDRDLQRVRDSVEEREELLATLEEEVDDLAAVSEDIEALERAANDRDEALDALEEDLAALESTTADEAALDRLTDDLAQLEHEVEEVAAMRETLVSALTNPQQTDVGTDDASGTNEDDGMEADGDDGMEADRGSDGDTGTEL